jgi:hypothetical protein
MALVIVPHRIRRIRVCHGSPFLLVAACLHQPGIIGDW